MNYWQIIETIMIFICTIIGFICFKKMKPNYLRIFLGWMTLLSSSEIIFYFFYNHPAIVLLVSLIYCFIYFLGYLIYSYIFYKRLQHLQLFKRYLIISVIFYGIFSIYSLIFRLNERNADNDSFLILSLLLIILMLYFFWQIISSKENIYLTKEPLFWIATGTLFYYTGNFIATGFFHRLVLSSKEFAIMLYKLNHILAIAQYILFSIAFILSTKKTKDV